MHEANLTRFGPQTCAFTKGTAEMRSAAFKAIDGPAKLVLRVDGVDGFSIKINGSTVVSPKDIAGSHEIVVPMTLGKDNTLEVGGTSSSTGTLGIRITQIATADLGLERQGYFGLNTSDMERQRAFYRLLGFKGEVFPAGPETSQTFAQSLGFEDDYLIYVSLHSLQDPPMPPFVDTVQFRGDSFREELPYARLNHLGMTYASYTTTNLDGDYLWLKSKGVEFLSPPATAPDGERFVFMKEPDGAFIKLIGIDGDPTSINQDAPNLVRLANTNMNVSDLERSREFYRLLGFTVSVPRSQAGGGEFAAAHGFDQPIEFDGVDVSLGEGTDGATLQLRQWKSPFDGSPPYPPPVNHLGIDRINFYVKDLTSAVKAMNELGFQQLGPIGGWPAFGIVFFFDPDGIKVQIAGPRTE